MPGEDERGFTLPELLTPLAIWGIVIAIAEIIFLAGLEHWRVNAATRQLVGDLRHSHASATNQLRDWRGVLALDRMEQEEVSRYYLIRPADPNGLWSPRPSVSEQVNGPTQTLATQVALRNGMW
jgi:prepilin-type N-terminal cleavage/methylation domain-containing protein